MLLSCIGNTRWSKQDIWSKLTIACFCVYSITTVCFAKLSEEKILRELFSYYHILLYLLWTADSYIAGFQNVIYRGALLMERSLCFFSTCFYLFFFWFVGVWYYIDFCYRINFFSETVSSRHEQKPWGRRKVQRD